jgi:hypothetical protein
VVGDDVSAARIGVLPFEAEKVVGRVWQALEEHKIATPKVSVTGRDRFTIELSFDSREDAKFVATILRIAVVDRAVAE